MGLKTAEKINRSTLKVGGVIMALSYFPQILQVIRTQSSQGISLAFISMVAFALATFTFNGYVVWRKTGDIGTMVSQLANLIPAVVLIGLILIFR